NAFDDAISVTADIRVSLSVTDNDGDTTTAASSTKIKLTFQDDGPVAVADVNQIGEDATAPVTGNVVLGDGVSGADSPGADGLGSVTWVGVQAGKVLGLYG